MSVLYEATDFEIHHADERVEFFVTSDNLRNVYRSMSFDQIEYIYDKILGETL